MSNTTELFIGELREELKALDARKALIEQLIADASKFAGMDVTVHATGSHPVISIEKPAEKAVKVVRPAFGKCGVCGDQLTPRSGKCVRCRQREYMRTYKPKK